MNWVIVAMVLVDVALIAFGVYRLTRTTVRPGLMGRMFSAGMLTSAEPPGLLPPSEHDVLQYRHLQVIAFETLGGGICGLILLSVCATLGHAVPLPYSPWTADSRTLVTMLFGSAGDVVGLTLGSRFGRILGRARVFRAVPNMLTGDVEMPRYVDLISRRLRVTLWIIPLANAALVVALVVLVTLQTGMGPSRAVSAL